MRCLCVVWRFGSVFFGFEVEYIFKVVEFCFGFDLCEIGFGNSILFCVDEFFWVGLLNLELGGILFRFL